MVRTASPVRRDSRPIVNSAPSSSMLRVLRLHRLEMQAGAAASFI
jgi:hypothetical protein